MGRFVGTDTSEPCEICGEPVRSFSLALQAAVCPFCTQTIIEYVQNGYSDPGEWSDIPEMSHRAHRQLRGIGK